MERGQVLRLVGLDKPAAVNRLVAVAAVNTLAVVPAAAVARAAQPLALLTGGMAIRAEKTRNISARRRCFNPIAGSPTAGMSK